MKISNKKRIFICLGTIVGALTLIFLLYTPVIFQEGNPTPLVKGIAQLNFNRNDIVQLNMEGDVYLSKSKNGQEALFASLNSQGYKFLEQMGAGYFFKNDGGDRLIATHRFYSRFYSIWNLTTTKDVKESIAWLAL